jgi:two-component system, NtrC family, sensor kinase
MRRRPEPPRYFEARDLVYFRLVKAWCFDWIEGEIHELTGYGAQDFLRGDVVWLDVVHEQDKQAVQTALAKALETDRYYLAEHRIVHKSGIVRWVKMRGLVACDDDGNYLSIQGAINETTVQKKTEMSLEAEHQAFASMADSLDDGIYIISADYRIEFMNRALIEVFGNRVGEVCYRALFDRETVCPWSVMHTITEEGCGFQEYQLPRLGKIYQVRSFPIKRADGSMGKLGQLKDITKTRRLIYEVGEIQARNRAISDAANMANLGIFIVQDHEGMEARFRYTNEAFSRISGYSSEELLDMGAPDIIHADDLEEAMERYRRRQHGEIMNQVYEIKMLRKDGIAITAFFSVAPSSYEGNTATVGFVRDITERKRVEKSLWLSQRLASIGKLAAEIAHEMNNPLTSVLTFSKLVDTIIQQEPFPVHRLPELRQYISMLAAETKRCANISRNLLDFSREGNIEVKENDIHDILQKTLSILKHRAEMSQIHLATSFAERIPLISCDYKRVQQAFVNLFWNAVEAMHDGGVLSVATKFHEEQNAVEIDIRDTGAGIPEENLERIFEPFFTTKAEAKGVGLGLSVAYGIIRQHGGVIRVSSEVGKGSRFTVLIKVRPPALGEEGNQHVV